MVLTPGIRALFESMASPDDTHLLKVELKNREPLYGYLRLIEAGAFVLEEAARDRIDKNTSNPYRGKPDYEYSVVKLRKTVLDIHLVTGYSEVRLDDPDLPALYIHFGSV